MTREEALLHNIPDNCIWEDKLVNCPQAYVYQSMDEYAKQQSISFVKWAIGKNLIRGNTDGDITFSYLKETWDTVYEKFLSTL